MITIEGIQVDLNLNSNSLSCSWAILLIELEFNNKLFIHHTFEQTALESLTTLIASTLKEPQKNIDLAQALSSSAYITVQVQTAQYANRQSVLIKKYELIGTYYSYKPYGYNILVGNSDPEQYYANILLGNLISRGLLPKELLYKKRGRTPRGVAQYSESGIFIKEYASIKEAAENTGLCASNISMCAKQQIKLAGGFIWKYLELH